MEVVVKSRADSSTSEDFNSLPKYDLKNNDFVAKAAFERLEKIVAGPTAKNKQEEEISLGPNSSFFFFPCCVCGQFCQSLEQAETHASVHQGNEDEEEEEEVRSI